MPSRFLPLADEAQRQILTRASKSRLVLIITLAEAVY